MTIVEEPTRSYKVAEVAEVEAAAADMTANNIQCRDFGHTWTIASIIRVKGVFQRTLWCKRCKTNRLQYLSMDGEVLSSNYTYEEGYQLKGMGRMLADGKNAIRREALERAATKGQIQDGDEEEEAVAPRARKRA